jgi:hypothetical protein
LPINHPYCRQARKLGGSRYRYNFGGASRGLCLVPTSSALRTDAGTFSLARAPVEDASLAASALPIYATPLRVVPVTRHVGTVDVEALIAAAHSHSDSESIQRNKMPANAALSRKVSDTPKIDGRNAIPPGQYEKPNVPPFP